MNRQEKTVFVSELVEKLKETKNFLVTEFHGLTVEEITELRNRIRPLKGEYKVVKNRLTKRVLEDTGYSELIKNIKGSTAIVVEKGDAIAISKAVLKFSKEHEKLKINSGVFSGKVLTGKEIISLTNLPSREVMLLNLVNTLRMPIIQMFSILQAPAKNLIFVSSNISKKNNNSK